MEATASCNKLSGKETTGLQLNCFLHDAEKRYSQLFEQLNYAKNVYDHLHRTAPTTKTPVQLDVVSKPPYGIPSVTTTSERSPRKTRVELKASSPIRKEESLDLAHRPTSIPRLAAQLPKDDRDIGELTSSLRTRDFKNFSDFLVVMERDEKIHQDHNVFGNPKRALAKKLSLVSLRPEVVTMQRGMSNPLTASESKACLDSINDNHVFKNNQRRKCERTQSTLMKRKMLKDRNRYGSILNRSASRLMELQRKNGSCRRVSQVANSIGEIYGPCMADGNVGNLPTPPLLTVDENAHKKPKVAAYFCNPKPPSECSQLRNPSKKKCLRKTKKNRKSKVINVTPSLSTDQLLDTAGVKVNKSETRAFTAVEVLRPAEVLQIYEQELVAAKMSPHTVRAREKKETSNQPKGYELPTLSSQQKQANPVNSKRFRGYIPFVGGTATSRSHNIGINVQSVLSIIKLGPKEGGPSPLAVAEDVLKESQISGLLRQPIASFLSIMTIGHSGQMIKCPAMLDNNNMPKSPSDLSLNHNYSGCRLEDLWTQASEVDNAPRSRCICFPTRGSVDPDKFVRMYLKKMDIKPNFSSFRNKALAENEKRFAVLECKIRNKKELLMRLYAELECLSKSHKQMCYNAKVDIVARNQIIPQIKELEERFRSKKAEITMVQGMLEELLNVKVKVNVDCQGNELPTDQQSGGRHSKLDGMSKQAKLLHTLQGLHGKLRSY